MPRGGSGRGQGTKPSWNTGKTKAVKLPELLIPEIVEFARMLDAIALGKDDADEVTPLAAEEAVDVLFDELVELKILDRAARKLIAKTPIAQSERFAQSERTVQATQVI